MPVERMWPTCIGLATFGELKSSTTVRGRAVQNLFPAEEQFTELSAPVADMIITDHILAKQAQGALKRIADAGGADVADMHRLGDIG